MRKETNKRGKCPRNTRIQRVKVPLTKVEWVKVGVTLTHQVVKNDDPQAGRTRLIHHHIID